MYIGIHSYDKKDLTRQRKLNVLNYGLPTGQEFSVETLKEATAQVEAWAEAEGRAPERILISVPGCGSKLRPPQPQLHAEPEPA